MFLSCPLLKAKLSEQQFSQAADSVANFFIEKVD